MMYQYSDYNKEVSFFNNIRFALRKLKKIYLLYFLTLALFFIYFTVQSPTKIASITWYARLLLNIFVIQEFFPIGFRSINGVSWFMCSMLFFWFIFPWIRKIVKKTQKTQQIVAVIVMLIVLQFVIGILSKNLIRFENYCSDIQEWLVYYCPLVRSIDCIIGCYLGQLYLSIKKVYTAKRYTNDYEEVFMVFANIIIIIIATYNSTTSMITHETWWICTLLFTPISCITVYLFALSEGKIIQILTNKQSVFIASISASAFLIHYVVLWLIGDIITCLNISQLQPYIVCITGFPITIFLSFIWTKISNESIK